ALIGTIIADGFLGDPINDWVFGSYHALRYANTAWARRLYLPRGFGHVTAGGEGGALWLPPGVAKHVPIWRSLDIGASMLRHGGARSLSRGLRVDATLARHHTQEPHYYLYAISVRPAFQGRGIGSALMRAALERVEQRPAPAYLESSKPSNVPFYRRFGFTVTRELSPAPGCPPMWLMTRPG
ncbi:MAG: GNAT family N-acetyltransferase, partial [Myxococcales bacterium]|nr:GNAT family N-acetyltransferase [Myxococcales bacterium]